MKFYVKEQLKISFGDADSAYRPTLNVYWTRASCGVRIKDGAGEWKDPYHFSFNKVGNSQALRLVVSIAAAAHLVPWYVFQINFPIYFSILKWKFTVYLNPFQIKQIIRLPDLTLAQACFILMEELSLDSDIDVAEMNTEYENYKIAGARVLNELGSN